MGVNGIYGLSGSGLDIESMVKVGMMSKQNEYDKMAQKYTTNEWKKTDFLELSSKITTFKDSTLTQYKMSNTMNAKSAESSNEAVKVSANSSAVLMNHKVDVTKLSSNAYITSTASPHRYGDSGQTSVELKDILFQSLSSAGSGKVNVTAVDGKTASNIDEDKSAIEFTLSDGVTKDANNPNSLKEVTIKLSYKEVMEGASIQDLVSKINKSGLNIKASYDIDNDRFSIYNTDGGAENKISITLSAKDVSSATRTLTYTDTEGYNASDGTTWRSEVTEDSTTAKVYSDVVGTTTQKFFNSWKIYQSKDGQLYKPGDTTQAQTSSNYLNFGAGEEYTLTTVTRHTYDYLDDTHDYTTGPSDSSNTTTTTSNTSKTMTGEDGNINVDGVNYTTTNNQVTVNGITYTALNTTTDATTGVSNPATINVSQDADSIIDKVKSFITDYNKILSDLYAKYDEKPNSDYKPLTQSQKDSMKEEQITKWEEKAKQGLLYHDQTLGRIIQNMRNSIVNSIELDDGTTVSLFSLGISTTGLKGQLTLDEDKLKKALAEDPDSVYKAFATLPENQDDWSTSSKIGVAQRLGDIFTEATKNIKSRAGSTSDITEDSDLNNLLRNLQTRMSNFKKMMNSFEDALYKKYDTMESTLARLATQMNYITGASTS